MKQTTEQIYNLITNNNFENLKQQLSSKVREYNWEIPERTEYTYEELIEDLPDIIDILKQSIEDSHFDYLPYQVRQQILQTLSQMSSHITNIYSGHQQFANLMDYTQTLKTQIRANRLDFEAKRIPRYKEKIKEYKELINELGDINIVLDTTKLKQAELEETLKKSIDIISKLQTHTDKAIRSEGEIGEKLENVTETYNQINALLATIQEHRDNITEILQEAKSSNSDIKEVEDEVNTFIEKIEENQTKVAKFTKETEDKIALFMTNTEEIVETNKKQQQEIDNQLQKAVGASLFSTFDSRKKDLDKDLNKWLIALGAILVVLIVLSGWIAADIIDASTNWYKVGIKVAISFPLIYMLVFISGRYKKERRLVEEYAFKSTISLALTPYADLIKKIEDEGADSKYRDFLISSIENIFSVPTDKAFGFNKYSVANNDKNNGKIVDEVLNLINKAKKAGQDIV